MKLEIIPYDKNYLSDVIYIFSSVLQIQEEESVKYINDTLKNKHGAIFLALMNEKILGLIRVTFEGWNMIGNIGAIAVLSEAKGKGVGKALMNKAEEFCFSSGVRKIYVDTAEDNPAAQIFYIKCGYFPEYSMKDYYSKGIDGVNFSKCLDK